MRNLRFFSIFIFMGLSCVVVPGVAASTGTDETQSPYISSDLPYDTITNVITQGKRQIVSRDASQQKLKQSSPLMQVPKVERLSERRIREYRTYYQQQLSNASWARAGMVGTVAASIAGAGYLGYRWATGSDDQSSEQPTASVDEGTLKEIAELSTKENKTEADKERLELLHKQLEARNRVDQAQFWKKQQELREYDRTFKGMAKRNFIVGVTGGISFAVMSLFLKTFDPLKNSIAAKCKDLWYRSEKQYFDLWHDRVLTSLEHMRALLVYAVSLEAQRENVPSWDEQDGYTQGCSYVVQLIGTHRMLTFATERLVGIMTLKPGAVGAEEVLNVTELLNVVSDGLEVAVTNSQNNKPAVGPQLLNSFFHAHDALMLLMQAYSIARE